VIVNPSDDEACVRSLGVPTRGIGDKSIDELREWALDRRQPLSRAIRSEEARGASAVAPAPRSRLSLALLERLALHASDPGRRARARVIEETRYFEWLARSAERDDVDREAERAGTAGPRLDLRRGEPAGRLCAASCRTSRSSATPTVTTTRRRRWR
jgi:superfamily I DNA/RNA helicase